MKPFVPAILVSLLTLASCSQPPAPPLHKELNSVYYWKTVFKPDSAETAFLQSNNVGRMYLRLFDVVKDNQSDIPDYKTYPNATVKFDESCVPDTSMEFVPVVYITLDALKAMSDQENVLAENIVTRVRNMCEYHELPHVDELQLDCDWTGSTQTSFFNLCKSVKENIADLGLNWRLSSTIRLHQLSKPVPPVDNGVLMVYNTGSFDNPDACNSILDVKDVEPYLKHLPGYGLHLDVAYPTYSWQLLFRGRHFVGLLNGVDLADSTRFANKKENVFIALQDVPYNNRMILEGDAVRLETSDFKSIAEVKKLIDKALAGKEHSNILYHLDSKNLSKYSADEIKSLYSTAD